MDFTKLSRKQLQVLCKANGIPANKTNVFMAESLASKRIPLSQVDCNREQKGSDSVPAEMKRRNGNAITGPTMNVVKPEPKAEVKEDISENPKFKNNFLRRGTRKDTPVRQNSAALGSAVGPDSADSGAHCSSEPQAQPDLRPADVRVASGGRLDNGRLNAERPRDENGLPSERAEVDRALSGTECRGIFSRLDANEIGKVHTLGIAESVRSQVDAALCSRVIHGTVHGLSDRTVVTKLEDPETCHGPDCRKASDQQEALAQSIPEMFAEKPTVLPTSCSHRDVADPDESPPLRLSPLDLFGEKIRITVERIRKFWGNDVQ